MNDTKDITVAELFVLFDMETGSVACHDERMALLADFGKTCSTCRYASLPVNNDEYGRTMFACMAPQFAASTSVKGGRLLIAHMDAHGCAAFAPAEDK